MPLTVITSPQNPKVKFVTELRERRNRDETGLILVEGYEEISLALESGIQPAELFYCPALFRDPAQAALIERVLHRRGKTHEISARVFEKLAYRENPDGWLATFPSPNCDLAVLRLSANPFVVVGEAVEKPGNLGAILRTADAAGVDALISCDPLTDWGNPNVVRASKGALFALQVAQAPGAVTRDWLRQRGLKIVVATPAASTDHTRADLRGPLAIVVGTEKHGLSQPWLEQSDLAIKIPMFGRVNSLNVATAAALLIYEVVRQRRS